MSLTLTPLTPQPLAIGSPCQCCSPAWSSVYNVKDYGAVGDGAHDDTTAFQSAIAAAQATSGVVYVPSGAYKLTSQLVVEGCTILGPGVEPFTNAVQPMQIAGAVLQIRDTVNPAISLRPGGSLDSLVFYYPDQTTGASPTVYPETVQCHTDLPTYSTAQGQLASIQRCRFINSYFAINTNGSSSTSSPFIRIQDNDICAISMGIKHPFSLIETMIAHNRFTLAFWAPAPSFPIRATISANAIAIQLGNGTDHVDGTTINDNSFFGFNKAIYFAGNATLTTISGNTIDGCCYGVDFTGVGSQTGEVAVTGGIIDALDPWTPTRRGYAIGAAWASGVGSSQIAISGVTFGQGHGDIINFSGASANASIIVDGCEIGSARSNDTTTVSYGVNVNGSGLIVGVNNCTFKDEVNQASGKMIGVSTAALLATITGNRFRWMDKSVDVSGTLAGRSVTVIGNTALFTNTQDLYYSSAIGRFSIANNRWSKGQGGAAEATSIASAATITLPDSDDAIAVTGTTNITSISASWFGRQVVLRFGGVLTVTDGSNLALAGNLTTALNTVLCLYCDGTSWYETSRSLN